MNTNPLVSIIVNNYNYGSFIKDAIDSALNQTYSNIEVIVVDDGSTDDSRQIISEYGNKIIPIFKRNGGQASALNAGYKVSHGEVIMFLDADDMLLSGAIENATKLFEASDVVKVHWPLQRVNQSGENTGGVVPQNQLAEGSLLDSLVMFGPAYFSETAFGPPTSGNAWSRYFLDNVFPLSEKEYRTGGVDYHLFVLAPVFGEIRKLEQPQGNYRIHGGNDTLKPINEYLETFLEWFEHTCVTLRHFLKQKNIDVDLKTWSRNSWYHKIWAAMQDIAALVPATAGFILVDGNDWGANKMVIGRKCFHFLEHEGKYWGPPDNDETAITELEYLRKNGAAYIIFTWTTFWWLEYYSAFHQYLKVNYKCILINDSLIVFDLQVLNTLP